MALFICIIVSVIATSSILTVVAISKDAYGEKNCNTEGSVTSCQGGGSYGDRPGGSGGRAEIDSESGEFTSSGGYGLPGDGEHGGFHCEGIVGDEQSTACVGSEQFRTDPD
ncbi:MAG TPA: hypothetical protein VLE21_05925 [Candidatus Nitrosocosmicus sp.]|nr:hypothetical protein [Candidatus Nitrosocosmicus sp.]